MSNENNEVSVFQNASTFEHAQRVAIALSKSTLVPKNYQDNVSDAIVAMEMAHRIGASPLMVMQNLYIVHGKPAWSSKFLIATLNASGKFSPLQYEEDDNEGGRCRAFCKDISTGDYLYGVWVSMEMANAEGWLNKNGSKWKTMPQLMRRYRSATFFVNQFAPELSMGIKTQDEMEDITPISVETVIPIYPSEKPELSDTDLIDVIENIKNGNYDLATLKIEYTVTDEQLKQIEDAVSV